MKHQPGPASEKDMRCSSILFSIGIIRYGIGPWRRSLLALVAAWGKPFFCVGQDLSPDALLHGVACYDEYIPYDWLEKEIEIIKELLSGTAVEANGTLDLGSWGIKVIVAPN